MTACRKSLRFLASRRGLLEMDRLLARFLEERLPGLTEEECQRVRLLLEHNDLDLLDWLSGLHSPPPDIDREVLAWISPFRTG